MRVKVCVYIMSCLRMYVCVNVYYVWMYALRVCMRVLICVCSVCRYDVLPSVVLCIRARLVCMVCTRVRVCNVRMVGCACTLCVLCYVMRVCRYVFLCVCVCMHVYTIMMYVL